MNLYTLKTLTSNDSVTTGFGNTHCNLSVIGAGNHLCTPSTRLTEVEVPSPQKSPHFISLEHIPRPWSCEEMLN